MTEHVDIQTLVRDAMRQELNRQAEACAELSVSDEQGRTLVRGPLDLDALAMVAAGALAGGP